MVDRILPNRLVVSAVAIIALPIGIVIGVLAVSISGGAEPARDALVAEVTAIEYDERRGVQIQLVWEPGPTLYAPTWTGTVGAVTKARSLANGDELTRIDGIARLVATTPEPFYRSLTSGTTGRDVDWMHGFLGSLGIEVPDGDVMTDASIDAVEEYARHIGVVGDVPAFDPAWVVWLPSPQFRVSSLALVAGAPAPAPGSEIAASRATLASVVPRPLDGSALQLDSTSDYILSVAGVDLNVNAEGNVDGEGRTRLADSLGGDAPPEEVQGSIRREVSEPVWSVPTSAVSTGPTGEVCIWVERNGRYVVQPVTVVGSQAGVTYVERPSDTARILVNPADALESTACPSS